MKTRRLKYQRRFRTCPALAFIHAALRSIRAMRRVAILIVLALAVSHADAQVINPPKEIRQANYGPSCVHAATITMLRWQQQPEMGAWWRKSYRGGENFYGLSSKARYAKLDYAILRNGKLGILDYATATRRGAVIDWGGRHVVFFCGFLGSSASIIDPNTNRIHTFEKKAFIAYWRWSGGRSFMTLYSPKQ